MKELLLVGLAREHSTRLPNKMIRKFCGTSLFEIYINKLERIKEMKNPFTDIIIAVNRNDKTLWKIAKDSSLNVCERSDDSVAPGYRGVADFQDFLKEYDNEYVMPINGCFPFLKEETILNGANIFINNEDIKSLTCGKYVYNFFWDVESNKPINNPNVNNYSTSNVNPLIEQIHCFHIYNKDLLFKKDRYWEFEKNDPYILLCNESIEFLDVDTEFDFKIIQSLYE